MVDLLSRRIVRPWLFESSFTKLHAAIVHLLGSTSKTTQHMKTNFAKSCHVKAFELPVRTPESNCQVSVMKAENIIKPEYKHFNKALSLKQLYKPLHLAKSRGLLCSKTLEGIFLALSFPIKMF